MKTIVAIFALLVPASLFAPYADKKPHFCHKYDYCDEIVHLSIRYGIEPEYTLALILHESISPVSYYKLSNKKYLRGKSGEYCPAQVMPYNFPKHLKESDYYKPQVCISASLTYLSKCYRRFGNYREALLCYNKGPNRKNWRPKYAEAIIKNYRRLKDE